MGDLSQQNFTRKLLANSVKGVIGYKLQPLLQTY